MKLATQELKAIFASVSSGMTEGSCHIYGRVRNEQTLCLYFRSALSGNDDRFRLVIEIMHDWRMVQPHASLWHSFGQAVSQFFDKQNLRHIPPCPKCGGVMGVHLFMDYLRSPRSLEVARLGCADYPLPKSEQGFRGNAAPITLQCQFAYPATAVEDSFWESHTVPLSPITQSIARLQQYSALLANIAKIEQVRSND